MITIFLIITLFYNCLSLRVRHCVRARACRQVRVCTLFGLDLGVLTVTADAARHSGDDAVVLSKQPFRATELDGRMYELDLLKAKPAHGFYTIAISVAPQKPDSTLLGVSGAEVSRRTRPPRPTRTQTRSASVGR